MLANDTDIEGSVLAIGSLADADASRPGIQTSLGATISIVDGKVLYDPTTSTILQSMTSAAFSVDTFTYSASDGGGGEDTATVNVRVNGADDKAPNFDGQLVNVGSIVNGTPFFNFNVVVGSGLERADASTVIDISATSIVVDMADYYSYPGQLQNVFTDVNNTIADIIGVTLVSSSAGLDQSDVSFTADSVTVDIGNVTFLPGEVFRLDVVFA